MTDLMKRYEAEMGHQMPERWDTWALIGWYDEYTNWLEYQLEHPDVDGVVKFEPRKEVK